MASNSEIAKRIKELESLLMVKRVDWGGIYDTLREMDLTMGQEDTPEFEADFIERTGTREDFIANKEREWRAKNVCLIDLLQAK